MNGAQYPNPFGQLVAALEPWLDQVVIVGGLAHKLYRLHPGAQALDYPPLNTLDADVALPASLVVGEQDIRAHLVAHGFTEELLGEDRPPATHYHLGGESSGFYVEFLTPLVGGEYGRKRQRKSTMEIAGISSQQLRHIELLLHEPWWIELKGEGLVGSVRVANPVTFVAQKILIHRKREREDRAKDILYVRDTLEVFGGRLAELAQLWRSSVAPQLQVRNARKVTSASQEMFGELSDDIRRAAEISPERALAPETIREACRHGLAKYSRTLLTKLRVNAC